jgi:hypothetical protein
MNQITTQILDYSQSQNDYCSNQLQAILKDIVTKVEIKADFSIQHPDYKPLEVPRELTIQLQNLPEQMQQKFFRSQLRSFLYGIYYNGSMRTTLALDAEENNLSFNVEKSVLGVDLEFYHRLHNSNSGQGYFESGWIIVQEQEDSSLVVKKNGLNLYIEREQHLLKDEQQAKIGDTVSIKMPKNRMQTSFYVAVGNERANLRKNASILVRIYFNLTPDGAVEVMSSLTQQLNEQNIPFDFKVLYNPQDYQRYDSGVLYFDKSNYQLVNQILQPIYQNHQQHFQKEIPLFTLQLAPGLALAEEPEQKFVEKESFGMNRCQIIANGLLEAFYHHKTSPDEKIKTILAQFSLSGIDLNHTYLNADSENIYFRFNKP